MRASITDAAVATAALVVAGCQPNFGTAASSVSSLRVLALSATPASPMPATAAVAEGAPGAKMTYAALLADGTGPRPDLAASIDWAFCNREKPLSDLADVDVGCFTYGASFLAEIGSGATVSGQLPAGACSLFGPDVPPAMMGMPAGRPADPDPTGGYYQPVRVILETEDPPGSSVTVLAAYESRILCGLPGASSDTLAMFKTAYTPNQNPEIASMTADGAVLAPDDGRSAGSVSAGQHVTLAASWSPCPAAPPGGCGAETYAYYDAATQAVTMQSEALTLSWFATVGSFDTDRTSVTAGDAATSSSNGWTAPSSGTVTLWAVLRDDRGGASWKQYRVDVH